MSGCYRIWGGKASRSIPPPHVVPRDGDKAVLPGRAFQSDCQPRPYVVCGPVPCCVGYKPQRYSPLTPALPQKETALRPNPGQCAPGLPLPQRSPWWKHCQGHGGFLGEEVRVGLEQELPVDCGVV